MAFAQAPRQRPGTVTTATWLLYLLAALQLLSGAIALAMSGPMREATRKALEGTPGAEAAIGFSTASIVVAGVVSLLLGVGYAVLGYFVGRGSNPARITTWVVAGLLLCCSLGSVGLTALGSGLAGSAPEGTPNQADIQREIMAALPGWYQPVTTGLGILAGLVALAVVILLALPASNAFFRKETQPAWEPPVPPATPPSAV
jgi:hypothetical protein